MSYSKEEWVKFKNLQPKASRIDVKRLEPHMIRGQKIDGFLMSLPPNLTPTEMVEKIYKIHGGGIYVINLYDDMNNLLTSECIYPGGFPIIQCNCSIIKLMNIGCKDKLHR